MEYRHAYLIIAHNDIDCLMKLINSIDDPRNDIFVHIDKKWHPNLVEIENSVSFSKIYIISNIDVKWGGDSQIKTELILLDFSMKHGDYRYFHLLSGADILLKNQDEIHEFFKDNDGLEFVDCRKEVRDYLFRIKYFYPFQNTGNGRGILLKIINKIGRIIQKVLQINRCKNIQVGYGSNWFSITNDFANYIIMNKDFIKKYFYKSICADEMFLQTILLKSPYIENLFSFQYSNVDDTFEKNAKNALRAIDFSRGNGSSPYIYDDNDFENLINSNLIFARKVNSEKSNLLIEHLEYYKNTGGKYEKSCTNFDVR